VKHTRWVPVAVLALALLGGGVGADTEKKARRDAPSFSTLRAPGVEEVKAQAAAWLKSAGKADAASQAEFARIWSSDGAVLEKVSRTLALGSAAARRALAEAAVAEAEAPTAVPAVLKDKAQPAFFRSNLALAYGKALAGRRVYEEGLEALLLARADEVADPAAYFFHKAVCEHALMLKDQADSTIDRLLVDVTDAPERYRMVAALMHFDMLTWQDKDLGWIARKMDNIQRRLHLTRGGKQTQKMQKEVLVRLDELIKEKENQSKCKGQCPNGGNCPGGQPGNGGGAHNPGNPMQDSTLPPNQGSGQVDNKRVRELAEVWGILPEKERAAAMQELTRGLPPRDRAVIEEFLRRIQERSGSR